MTDRLCGGFRFRKVKKEALSKFLKVRQWIETDPDLSVRGDWVRSRSSSQVFFCGFQHIMNIFIFHVTLFFIYKNIKVKLEK